MVLSAQLAASKWTLVLLTVAHLASVITFTVLCYKFSQTAKNAEYAESDWNILPVHIGRVTGDLLLIDLVSVCSLLADICSLIALATAHRVITVAFAILIFASTVFFPMVCFLYGKFNFTFQWIPSALGVAMFVLALYLIGHDAKTVMKAQSNSETLSDESNSECGHVLPKCLSPCAIKWSLFCLISLVTCLVAVNLTYYFLHLDSAPIQKSSHLVLSYQHHLNESLHRLAKVNISKVPKSAIWRIKQGLEKTKNSLAKSKDLLATYQWLHICTSVQNVLFVATQLVAALLGYCGLCGQLYPPILVYAWLAFFGALYSAYGLEHQRATLRWSTLSAGMVASTMALLYAACLIRLHDTPRREQRRKSLRRESSDQSDKLSVEVKAQEEQVDADSANRSSMQPTNQ